MDEFDVFMDSQNRSMTVELLVEAAKKNCRKQFIFVTPNYLSRSGGEGPEVGSSERSSRIDRRVCFSRRCADAPLNASNA
ncbi:hypothetical protein PC110_g19539 [Phytophthora cactorum]|uniref:P-loop containing nucleoside triphosphate hydrolase n=2 Tax=Phytophthora cactorum TaxID=29920 RepID=A0A329RHI8_9STRA|nr:hypothetical protein PC110_g19539 [Phytophthora cactorum]